MVLSRLITSATFLRVQCFSYLKPHQNMATNSRAAVASMLSTSDKQANLEQIKEIIAKTKESGAKIVFFPEGCDYIGENRYQTLELAEPLSGEIVQTYQKLAANNQLYLSMGGVHEAIFDEKGEKTNRVYNTHLIINSQGDIVAKYRKLHMFNVDTPEFKYRESEIAKAGEEIVAPVESPIGNIGLQICYDLRFPEVSAYLRKLGATILTYPSAFSVSTGKAHWEVLLRSRAIETQCYVIAAAQNGQHNKKRSSYGHALIVDPWGKVIAQCDQGKSVDVAFAEIDNNTLNSVRADMPCFDHRRDDLYKIYLSPSNKVTSDSFMFGPHPINKDTVFYESPLSFAFTNIRCVVKGHVLVASKKPHKLLTDLTKDESRDFFETVALIEKVSCKVHSTTSTTINVQNGEFSGQTVDHVHCHIMPRRKGDFKFNDMIYIELAKHDAPDVEESTRRPLEDMIAEAEIYRKCIKEMNLVK